MINKSQILEKLLFSYPIMMLYYSNLKKIMKDSRLKKLKNISLTIFYIQITFHTYQCFTGTRCNPTIGRLCNSIALLFGITHTLIYLYSYCLTKEKSLFLNLSISSYMVLSHLTHIKLL
jgi:hypothetical protein